MQLSEAKPAVTGKSGSATAPVVAVVVTFNRLHHLKLTVARLLKSPPEALSTVLVVDNASTDGTGAWLAEQADPRLCVLSLARNGGGAGGFAAGITAAIQDHGARWVAVMDDDARPAAEGPDPFVTFAARDRDEATAWAAAVRYPDGRICDMNRPSLNPFDRPKVFLRTLFGGGREGYHIPHAAYDPAEGTRPIDITSFVGLFISARIVAAIGPPEAGLFIYGDDVIYSLNLRRAGYELRFDPTLLFEHDCATLSPEAAQEEGEDRRARLFSPLWKTFYATRNRLFMYRKATGPILFWPLAVVLILAWFWAARRYPEAERQAYLSLLRMGVGDGLRHKLGRPHDEIVRIATP